MNSLMKRTNGSTPATTFSGLIDKIFQNNVNRLFDDDFWGFNGNLHNSQNANVPVNIRETNQNYELQLVAPGMKKEDFKVNVGSDMLTVSFEQKEEHSQENKEEGWLRKEYQKRSFTRSFNLDDTIDVNKIDAKYADGILHLTMPKKEGAKPISRTIEIK